ncbi:MAG: FAD-dependent oxidoreductase [Spirochaetes bacterium]|nr:MAG: FAD-dependent oxidoreductase [Spirochaetota bacterium]
MKVVIIGNGPASLSAVEAIRKHDRDSKITVISKEREPAYTPCFLSRYLSGEIEKEKLFLRDSAFYSRNNVELLQGVSADGIETRQNRVILLDGRKMGYDKLLLAGGANPVIPNIPGIDGEGVYYFKTLSDAEKLKVSVHSGNRAVVIGGGFIGLEIAKGLSRLGLNVTIVEKEGGILPRMLDNEIARKVQGHLEEKGMVIYTGYGVKSIKRGGLKKKLKEVELDNGKSIPADVLVVAMGVKPNLDIIEGSSVRADTVVLVNERMQTNVENIFSAGDMAEVEIDGKRRVNPIHFHAVKTGEIAGANIAGIEKRLDAHVEDMNTVILFDLPVVSMGERWGEKTIIHERSDRTIKVYLQDGCINGIQMLGNRERGGVYFSCIMRKISFSDERHLLSPRFNYGLTYAGSLYGKTL